jgi:hypothetical protein
MLARRDILPKSGSNSSTTGTFIFHHLKKSFPVQHGTTLGHHILLQSNSILAKESAHAYQILSNNMNKEDSSSF